MSKKLIAFVVVFTMIFTLGINVFAANAGMRLASGETAEMLDGAAGNTAEGNGITSGATPGGSTQEQTQQQGTQGQAAVPHTTRTMDNSEAIVEQNRTKHNAMMNDELSEKVALSRYSSRRVALPPDIQGTMYEDAAEVLGALGIMVGDAEDGAFRPNDNILRSEMAKVAVYSVGLEDLANGANIPTRFPDVGRRR